MNASLSLHDITRIEINDPIETSSPKLQGVYDVRKLRFVSANGETFDVTAFGQRGERFVPVDIAMGDDAAQMIKHLKWQIETLEREAAEVNGYAYEMDGSHT